MQSVPVPRQSAAVERETQRHAALYNKIAQQNSNAEYAQAVSQPRDSAAVGKWKSLTVRMFNNS